MAQWDGEKTVAEAPVDVGDLVHHPYSDRYHRVTAVVAGGIHVVDCDGQVWLICSEDRISWLNPQSIAALFLGLSEPTEESRKAARGAFTELSKIVYPK